ncbi:MAG: PAS domain-containing protein [Rhizobiales bacterium]|nr:PAS domain-containing protein [Hyphomicrobiales bacterium]NRB13764.1 PAS domain-containing protein [Hyphomicrobiales bacterium]
MKLQTTKYLYEYWNELRGKRIAPVRKELDPDVLKNILPNLFLLDRVNSNEYNFRLAGAFTSNIFGEELRDRNFLDLWNENDKGSFVSLFNTLTEQGAAIICGLKGKAGDEIISFEFLALPLFHAQGDYCSSIIGSFGFNEDVESKLFFPLEDVEMVSLRVIWPVEKKLSKPKAVVNVSTPIALEAAQPITGDPVARRASFTVIDGGKN